MAHIIWSVHRSRRFPGVHKLVALAQVACQTKSASGSNCAIIDQSANEKIKPVLVRNKAALTRQRKFPFLRKASFPYALALDTVSNVGIDYIRTMRQSLLYEEPWDNDNRSMNQEFLKTLTEQQANPVLIEESNEKVRNHKLQKT